MNDKKNMRVVVRVRPFNHKELEMNQRNIIKVLDKETLIFDGDDDDDEFFFHGQKQVHRDVTKRVKKKLTMEYDDIHDTDSTNDELFENCTRPLVVDWLMNGYNCSVFVYGATGAGKTFTMLGNEETPGITFLTMRELFASIEKHSENRKFDIGISYLEVYNEQVMNLLTKSGPLTLRDDASGGVVVGGLVLKQIHNADELLKLLALGNLNRTQHPTDANAESSRSHAIFQVHIRMTDKTTSQKRTVKLSMIDLAGSERAASNFKSNSGCNQRFKEGANINKSLLALGNCINKLADGLKHIPYRDSNLTRILKDSLGGNCRTIMIANVSPSSVTYDDTYNTLKYASRAKKIRIQLTKNVVQTNMPKEYLVKKVVEQNNENEKLKERIKMLEAKLALAESAVRSSSSTNGCLELEKTEPDVTMWYEKIDMIYSSIKETQDQYFRIQSKEKILKFRATFKEFAEKLTKILTLDGSHINENINRLEASIDSYTKQMAGQKEEMRQKSIKFTEAHTLLVQLRQEIFNIGLMSNLELYFKNKDLNLELGKANMNNQHAQKMHDIYRIETNNWKKSMMLSSTILNDNYFLLRHSDLVDNSLKEKLEKLIKINRGKREGVKFAEDDVNTDSNIEDEKLHSLEYCHDEALKRAPETFTKRLNEEKLDHGGKKKMLDVKGVKVFAAPKPKAVVKSFCFANNDALARPPLPQQYDAFKVPQAVVFSKPPINMNETQILSKVAADMDGIEPFSEKNLNATFQMPEKNADGILSSVVIGNKVSSKNTAVMTKVLKQSTQKGFVLSQVGKTATHKENKKFTPNRIKKTSPRLANRFTSKAIAASVKPRFKTVPTTPTRKSHSKLIRVKK